jgi:hypothetical protein
MWRGGSARPWRWRSATCCRARRYERVAFHSFALCSSALCSVALCSFALCSFALCSVALCSVALCSVALYSVALCSVALYSVRIMEMRREAMLSDARRFRSDCEAMQGDFAVILSRPRNDCKLIENILSEIEQLISNQSRADSTKHSVYAQQLRNDLRSD